MQNSKTRRTRATWPLRLLLLFLLLSWSLFPTNSQAQDIQQLRLFWTDTCQPPGCNEDGYELERAPALAGPFTLLNKPGPNSQNYVDQGLKNATLYCYRILAYNAGGRSGYAGPTCGKTRAILDVTKVGSGTVTSAPAGINCGPTCSSNVIADTQVTLAALPAAGWTFTGWSGPCAGTGVCVVAMTAARAVTATFAAIPPPPPPPPNPANLIVE